MIVGKTKSAAALLAAFIALTVFTGGCAHKKPNAPAKPETSTSAPATHKRKIAFVMKLVGIPYTDACKRGMTKAATELGVDAVFLGPAVSGDAKGQVDIIEKEIADGVDAIVISPNDAEAVKPSIAKAIGKGVPVFTWDSDAPDSGRIFYVCGADDYGIGTTIIDHIASDIGGKGKVAIITGGAAAPNLNLHIKGLEIGARKYPGIQLLKPYIYDDESQDKAIQGAVDLLKAHPDVSAFACINSPGVPGAARAVVQVGKEKKIKIWGLSLPSENGHFIKKGIVSGLVIWDPAKLTYLTTVLVNDYLDGKKPKDGMEVPGVGVIRVGKTGVITMPGITVTRQNVDQFNF